MDYLLMMLDNRCHFSKLLINFYSIIIYLILYLYFGRIQFNSFQQKNVYSLNI